MENFPDHTAPAHREKSTQAPSTSESELIPTLKKFYNGVMPKASELQVLLEECRNEIIRTNAAWQLVQIAQSGSEAKESSVHEGKAEGLDRTVEQVEQAKYWKEKFDALEETSRPFFEELNLLGDGTFASATRVDTARDPRSKGG